MSLRGCTQEGINTQRRVANSYRAYLSRYTVRRSLRGMLSQRSLSLRILLTVLRSTANLCAMSCCLISGLSSCMRQIFILSVLETLFFFLLFFT